MTLLLRTMTLLLRILACGFLPTARITHTHTHTHTHTNTHTHTHTHTHTPRYGAETAPLHGTLLCSRPKRVQHLPGHNVE